MMTPNKFERYREFEYLYYNLSQANDILCMGREEKFNVMTPGERADFDKIKAMLGDLLIDLGNRYKPLYEELKKMGEEKE